MKILNIGSINKDFFYSVNDFVKPGETISSNKFHVKIGGKGLNQSVAISKAGKKVYHAGIINKDDKFLIDKLKKWNVNCDNILFSDNPTGHAIIQVNKRGENSIIIHAGANYDLDKKFIASTISKFESEDILLIQKEVNSIGDIIDIGYEQKMKIIFNPAPFKKEILNYDLNKISILILNYTEAKNLSGQNTPTKILDFLNKKYKETEIILTLGNKGSIYSFNGNMIKIDAKKIKTIDSTGAGDTFIGYYVASIAKGLNTEESLKRANKAAAISTTKLGAAESIPEIN